MKILFLLFAISFMSSKVVSQPDTMLYKKQVEYLMDQSSIQSFLDTLFIRDSFYRGELASDMFDLENLISISYYVNRYGYPSYDDFGEASKTPWMIWKHTKYNSLRILSFPLILKGYQAGEISEDLMKNYLLKAVYKDHFDNNDYKHIPYEDLYTLLGLNIGELISIESLITKMKEIRLLNSTPKKEVLRWYGEELSKWVTENGERKWWTTRGAPVEIITLENCKIYFRKDNVDHSAEPYELMKIGEKKFRYKNRETDKYFEIDPNGNLLYRDAEEVFDLYKKVE